MMRSVLDVICFLDMLFMLHSKFISETHIGKVAPMTLFPMENWKKCRFDFQTCINSNQDYSETVKDISSEKIRPLENSIVHNRPVPKLGPLPQGDHKKTREKMYKTYARHCTVLLQAGFLYTLSFLHYFTIITWHFILTYLRRMMSRLNLS